MNTRRSFVQSLLASIPTLSSWLGLKPERPLTLRERISKIAGIEHVTRHSFLDPAEENCGTLQDGKNYCVVVPKPEWDKSLTDTVEESLTVNRLVRWIAVTERLPYESLMTGPVLVYKDGHVTAATLHPWNLEGIWRNLNGQFFNGVSHWAAMPNGPTERITDG